jgi:hypothetical protein
MMVKTTAPPGGPNFYDSLTVLNVLF